MLDLANDIRSLSDFKRNTVEPLDRLRKTGHPLILTINGKAKFVVQDAEACQALLDRVEAVEGIQRGLADVQASDTKPARRVFDRRGPTSKPRRGTEAVRPRVRNVRRALR